MLTLLFYIFLLVLTTLLIHRYARLPTNISLLFLAQPLIISMAPVMVFVGGFIAEPMTEHKDWVTLPVTMMVLGTAAATVPAAMLARRLGRKTATILGFSMSVIGGLTVLLAINNQWFWLFVVAAFFMGNAGAFAQQLRFAAIENLNHDKDIPKAVALLMLTGLFSALIGPELAVFSKDLWPQQAPYFATYVGLISMALMAMLIISRLQLPPVVIQTDHRPERPLSLIIKQPVLWVAVISGALGYGLMSFMMTATPLSMHQIHLHSLEDTKWVIQSHVAAMYLPSFLTLWLGSKIPTKYFLLSGTLLYILVLIIAMSGVAVMHYWLTLVILGIGWNFLFYTGTTLLPQSYRPQERHKAQALNDFMVFSFQAGSSLMAGWVVYRYQWHGIVMTGIPFVIILAIMTFIRFYNTAKHQNTNG
ncbi:MFS transporter [Marinicella gelatinilytica]|uniref:MFS transporter n=1 Tax=Marinicella gelatinilytica TaxID=2996017 RepID=UPI002260A1B1|nr:MFS transporter [Marinicella gelatinilytica]MCX7544328.1 MFS transporter [Marinicella gelatinilytica]